MILALIAIALMLGAFAWWRFYFFHRNPHRVSPPGAEPVCPADGRILYVENVTLSPGVANAYHRRVQQAFNVEGEWTVVATYLSIFDVHFVRSPIEGRVRMHHVNAIQQNASMGGSFFTAALRRPLPMGHRDYTQKNEFLGLSIDGEVRVLLVLMADWWIDQIYALVNDGDEVKRGQLLGKIQMGSQVDLWVPAGVIKGPTVGDAVRAGESVLVS